MLDPLPQTRRARRSRTLDAWTGLLALWLAMPGCEEDDDTPVEPDPPGGEIIYHAPNTPEHVLYNLLTAYQRREMIVYESSLHDSFRFEGRDAAGDPVMLSHVDELRTTSEMLARVSSVVVDWPQDTRATESTLPGFPAEDGYRTITLDAMRIDVTPDDGSAAIRVDTGAVFVLLDVANEALARHHVWRVVYQEELPRSGDDLGWGGLKQAYLPDDGNGRQPDFIPR